MQHLMNFGFFYTKKIVPNPGVGKNSNRKTKRVLPEKK